MAETLFTLPGRIGDNLARLKVAHRWARERRARVDLCLDPASGPLEGLLLAQDWVDRVLYAEVHNYNFGGQPWDFGKDAWFRARYREVWHLGFRAIEPITRHLTHEALERSGCPVRREGLLEEPCIALERGAPRDLLVHLEASPDKPEVRRQALETLLPVFGILARAFRRIRFAGLDPDSPLYAPFRGSGEFVDSRSGMLALLGPLATSAVLCVDSAVRWLAFDCGVPSVVLRHDGSVAFRGARAASETVLRPYDSSGVLRALGIRAPFSPRLALRYARRRAPGLLRESARALRRFWG